MTTRFASSYNAINLLRNGGLDFVKDAVTTPAFWAVEGAKPAAPPPDNAFTIVTGEDPKVEIGAARYFKVTLCDTTPVFLAQELLDRFVQMAFDEEFDGWNPASGDLGGGSHSPPDRLDPNYSTLGCQVVSKIPLTFAFSMRVLRGVAGAKVRMEKGSLHVGVAETTDTVATVANASNEWQRFSVVIDPGDRLIKRVGILLEKSSAISGLAEVHIGAIQMSIGSIGDLPYTGDPMADAIPKGTIVFAFGDACPAGFEKLEFPAPPVTGRVFFKDAKPVSLAVEGEESHDHTDAEMVMNPEENWDRIFLIPTYPSEPQNLGIVADSAVKFHQHTLSKTLHVPSTRDVILCKRV
jgi:hypothetical protein